MNLFRLLRFFLPQQNPVGFGLVDFIEFAAACLFIGGILLRARIESAFRRVAARPRYCAVALALLPCLLRLALLPRSPVPTPNTADDFSWLLLGDTLSHFRLANPMHPMHRFFESVFTLQEPTWSSIFPLGPGFMLAAGILAGHPWTGVVIATGVFCAACFWMLRAWLPAPWALLGGLLAVIEFGPLSSWMNAYWGGTVSAIAGCLVFGSIPRLLKSLSVSHSILLGVGLGLQMLTRPWESVLLDVCVLPVAVFVFRKSPDRRHYLRLAAMTFAAILPAVSLIALQNKSVTGRWTTLPYSLSREQYGIPTTFTFQPVPVPARPLTPLQEVDYKAQSDIHGKQPETLRAFLRRLANRIRFYRFYLLPPLYLACLFFIPLLRAPRYLWAVSCIFVFALGTGFYPYFYPHYVAALTCLFVLISTAGIRHLSSFRLRRFSTGRDAARIVVLLCFTQFFFWYTLHMFGNDELFTVAAPWESWNFVNFGDPESRAAVNRQLAETPGRHLVFVRYGPPRIRPEWVHNAAGIDAARVVWALDLGPQEDKKLIDYYPGRTVWLVEPDMKPTLLTRLRPE